MMEKEHFSDAHQLTWGDLSGSLQGLRDALITVSLALHDYQFELDANRRHEIELLLQESLEKLKNAAPLKKA